MNDVNDIEEAEPSLGGKADKPILTLLVMVAAGLVFIWQQVDWRAAMEALVPGAMAIRQGRWDGLLTSVFAHGDLLHIFFNLSWVWLLGRVLEANVSKFFWILVLVTCAGFASAVEFAFTDQLGIGLSGVVYGWAGFVWFARGRYPAFHGVINKQTALWLAGWLVFCWVMTEMGKMHIANGAHLGGLVAGSLIGLAANGRTRYGVLVCLGLLGVTVGSLVYAPWSPSYNALGAVRALGRGDYAQARKMMDRVLAQGEDLAAWVVAMSADINVRQGTYGAAVKDYERGYPALKDDADFMNRYAWLLATCPQDDVRDGAKAITLAQRAVELTDGKEAGFVDTLAAAYAETGDFAEAVKWQARAVALAPDEQELAAHLRLYQAGRPYHEAASQ